MSLLTSLSKLLFLPVLCLFLTSTPVTAQNLWGKVVSIADGDTVTILDSDKRQHKIRLYGIDTPEKGQAFGKAAKKYTSRLVARKNVQVISYDTDRYGRTVGVVLVDGKNVNQNLIGAGLAWQYRKYCKASFCDDWLQLEKKAKTSKVGLWTEANPVQPWEWRKVARNSSYSKSVNGIYAPTAGNYHGNIKSHVFHSPRCRHYNCKNCTKVFNSRENAVTAGYRPCGQCKP